MKARIAEATVFAALTYFLFASVLPTLAEAAQGSGYNWSKVRMGGNGKADTVAFGMNNTSEAVGSYWYRDGTSREGLFLYRSGRMYKFTLPGTEDAMYVRLDDIGKWKAMVGTFYEKTDTGIEGPQHAFLYRWTPRDHVIIDFPGAFHTFPFAINDKRQVAMGYFQETDPNTTQWGAAIYDYYTGVHTPVTAFGLTDVGLRGMNNHGDLVGIATQYDNASPPNMIDRFAFVRWKGQDLELVHPEGFEVTPYAINDHGVIVGLLGFRGFKLDLNTGVWEIIVHPTQQGNDFFTQVTDIDNNGNMLVISERISTEGPLESWWVKPTQPKTVARR